MFDRTDVLRRTLKGLTAALGGLGLLGCAVAAAALLVVSDVPYTVARAVYTGFAAANGTANYGYYVDLIRHGRSWNFRTALATGG